MNPWELDNCEGFRKLSMRRARLITTREGITTTEIYGIVLTFTAAVYLSITHTKIFELYNLKLNFWAVFTLLCFRLLPKPTLNCDTECRGTLLEGLLHLTLNQSHACSLRLSKKQKKNNNNWIFTQESSDWTTWLPCQWLKEKCRHAYKRFLIRGSEKYRSSRILLMTAQPELWTPFARNLFCASLHQLCLIFIQINSTFISLPCLPYSQRC